LKCLPNPANGATGVKPHVKSTAQTASLSVGGAHINPLTLNAAQLMMLAQIPAVISSSLAAACIPVISP